MLDCFLREVEKNRQAEFGVGLEGVSRIVVSDTFVVTPLTKIVL